MRCLPRSISDTLNSVSVSTMDKFVSFNGNTVQKVAGTLRVPSADSQKALLFEGRGTWNVPAPTACC